MKRGRKTLLTATLQKQLCDLLTSANNIKTSCAATGICRAEFSRLVRKEACISRSHHARARDGENEGPKGAR